MLTYTLTYIQSKLPNKERGRREKKDINHALTWLEIGGGKSEKEKQKKKERRESPPLRWVSHIEKEEGDAGEKE